MRKFEIGFRRIDLFNLSVWVPLTQYSFNKRVIVTMCVYVYVGITHPQYSDASRVPRRDFAPKLRMVTEYRKYRIARKQKRDNSKGTSLLDMYWISGFAIYYFVAYSRECNRARRASSFILFLPRIPASKSSGNERLETLLHAWLFAERPSQAISVRRNWVMRPLLSPTPLWLRDNTRVTILW